MKPTYESLIEDLNDIKENTENFKWYLEHGCTMEQFYQEIDILKENTKLFIQHVKDYSTNQILEEMERIKNDL